MDDFHPDNMSRMYFCTHKYARLIQQLENKILRSIVNGACFEMMASTKILKVTSIHRPLVSSPRVMNNNFFTISMPKPSRFSTIQTTLRIQPFQLLQFGLTNAKTDYSTYEHVFINVSYKRNKWILVTLLW